MNLPIAAPPPHPVAMGNPLQHVKTLVGLSRRRLSQDDILDLIETGRIQWAWDIGRAGSGRPELRIWRDSLVSYLVAESGLALPIPMITAASLQEVVETILPRIGTGAIQSRQLCDRLLCCPNHIGALLRDGELQCLQPPRAKAPTSILYQSAAEFLQRRCLSI